MVEGPNLKKVNQMAQTIAGAVHKEIGANP